MKNNKNVISEIFDGYKGGEEMPLAGYATLLGVYNSVFLAMLLTLKENNADDSKFDFSDFLLLSAATFKLSRLISRDRVTSPLRAPFMEYI